MSINNDRLYLLIYKFKTQIAILPAKLKKYKKTNSLVKSARAFSRFFSLAQKYLKKPLFSTIFNSQKAFKHSFPHPRAVENKNKTGMKEREKQLSPPALTPSYLSWPSFSFLPKFKIALMLFKIWKIVMSSLSLTRYLSLLISYL